MAGKLPLEDDAYRIPDREVWRRYLMADPRYGSLIKYLTKQELPSDLAERERLKRAAGFHFVEDGLLYYRQSTKIGEQHVLIVPAEYRRDIIRLYHDHPMSGHRAAPTVRNLIARSFKWSTMRADIKRYVHSCLKCFLSRSSAQRGGALKNQGLLATWGSEVDKFSVIHIDFVGPLPEPTPRENRFIFTIKDRGTGFLEAWPTPDCGARTAASVLWNQWFMRFGIPKAIVSDRGSAFRSDLFKNLAYFAGYDLKPTTAYHPQTNGLVEREHKNLKQYMRAYCMRDQTQWDLLLSSFTFACNSICKDRLSYPPAFLVYGVYPRLPAISLEKRYFVQNMDEYVAELLQSLADATKLVREEKKAREAKEKKSHDAYHVAVDFKKGDVVWRHSSRPRVGGSSGKFAIPWEGPFEVIDQPDPGSPTYVIADKDGNQFRLHAQHLARFVAYEDDRRLVSDEKHAQATLGGVLDEFTRATRPPDEDKKESKTDGSVDAPATVRKKPIPAVVGSAPTLVPEEKVAVRPNPKKPDEEKKAKPLVSKILDSLPPSEQPLAEFLSKKFVILPHQLRPDEETLHCVVGPELTAHRYAAVHRAESGAKKQYDAFYWDPAVGMYETISATSNKHTKEREPCLSTLRRDQILLVFDKLSRRQIPRDTLQAFVDLYGRLPLITWRL
jgi:transposase InsO family protein